jgi:hypothetical protein
VATATAFAVTERLKLEDSPVLRVGISDFFSPVCKACKPEARSAQIRFRLRREEQITLDIVDSTGAIVRHSVGAGVFRASAQHFAWDGRDDSGKVVADGIYRAELRLIDENRTFEIPEDIRVDTTPPTIEVGKLRHPVFSPDHDGRADRVDLPYKFDELAYAILYLDGKKLMRGPRRLSGSMQWYGRGKPPGEYRLALAAQDLAGNVSPSTREFAVRIRYVELFKRRYVVRGSVMHLRLSTDARSVRWQLGGRSGVSKPPKLAIPVPSSPGSYRLTVTANGHRAVATVVVKIARR